MPNLYTQIKEILAPGRREIAKAVGLDDGIVILELPGGGRIRARGQAEMGKKYFVQEGVIQGNAPDLPVVTGTV